VSMSATGGQGLYRRTTGSSLTWTKSP
jgi:hypothetical protein